MFSVKILRTGVKINEVSGSIYSLQEIYKGRGWFRGLDGGFGGIIACVWLERIFIRNSKTD